MNHVGTTLAPFLLPEEFKALPMRALAHELRMIPEAGRYAAHRAVSHVGHRRRQVQHHHKPVLLVPGFLAGDYTLAALNRHLRDEGYRTYRSGIHSNVSCVMRTAGMLEQRLERIVERRGEKAHIVGHSLGGMLARGLAVRRPDLVAGIVTLGSPMSAPGAHVPALSRCVDLLVLLSRLGVPQVMAADCVRGDCALESWTEMASAFDADVPFTALYSRGDGIAAWQACMDPAAEPVEVRSSHIGMAFDPVVARVVTGVLARHAAAAAERLEVAG